MFKHFSIDSLASFRLDSRPPSLRSEAASSEAPSLPTKARTVVIRDVVVRAELLSCALIDILKFVYEIADDDFPAIMATADPSLYGRALAGVTRLLKLQEQDEVLEIADAVAEACIRVANNHHSLITMTDRAYIITNVIEPAKYLAVEPMYIIEQLQNLSIHRWHTANVKKSLLYTNTMSHWNRRRSLFPSGWLVDKKHTLLAKRLVSDDITVANLNASIGDSLRTILGTAIAEFSKHHCRVRTGSIERAIYAEATPTALAREAQHWEVMARRKRNERDYSTMPVPARRTVAYDNFAHIPQQLGMTARDYEHSSAILPELSFAPEPDWWRAEANRVTRGVRADLEQLESLLLRSRPDIEAPEKPYVERSQSVVGVRPRPTTGLQRSASMTLKSVREECW